MLIQEIEDHQKCKCNYKGSGDLPNSKWPHKEKEDNKRMGIVRLLERWECRLGCIEGP